MMKNKHQLKKELSFEKFIEAGYKVFAQKGFDKATIDDISQEAGYSKGAFYVHFKSKDELFVKIDELRDTRRADAYKAVLSEDFQKKASFEEVIGKLVDILVSDSYGSTDWGLLAMEYLLQNARNKEMLQLNSAKYDNWKQVIEHIIDWGIASGDLDPETDKAATASAVFALYDGYFVHAALYPGKVDKEHITAALLRQFGCKRKPPL